MASDSGFKVPKIVVQARAALKEAGLEITGNALKNTLDAKQFNNLACAFRNSLTPDQKHQYKQLPSDDERRSFIPLYTLDPEMCRLQGYNKTAAVKRDGEHEDSEWLLECQLDGPNYLNCTGLAKQLIAAGEFDSRPSRWKSLAANGVLEYEWTRTHRQKYRGTVEEAGVEAKCDVSAEQYQLMKDNMQDALGQPAQKKTEQG